MLLDHEMSSDGDTPFFLPSRSDRLLWRRVWPFALRPPNQNASSVDQKKQDTQMVLAFAELLLSLWFPSCSAHGCWSRRITLCLKPGCWAGAGCHEQWLWFHAVTPSHVRYSVALFQLAGIWARAVCDLQKDGQPGGGDEMWDERERIESWLLDAMSVHKAAEAVCRVERGWQEGRKMDDDNKEWAA